MPTTKSRPFKVGDRVRHTNRGAGTVVEDDGADLNGAPWWVLFDDTNYASGHSDGRRCCDTHDLTLIGYQPVTDEQRTAYWALHQALVDAGLVHLLDALAPSLPAELNHPPLPSVPGWYIGYDKVEQAEVVLHFDEASNANTGHTGRQAVANPERFAPFHRLVRGDQ